VSRRRPARPGRPRRRAGAPGPAPGRASRWRTFRIALAIVLASAVVVAALLVPRPRPPVPDPLEGLDARAAADSFVTLVARQRMLEAVPYVRRMERLQTRPSSEFQGGFAALLSNATTESRSVHGLATPVTRSAAERVALVREALERLDRAEQLATDDARRGDVVVTRARILSMWGFQREAYLEYRRAHALRPLDPHERSEAAWIEAMLEDPTRPTGTNPAAGAIPVR
jgi:hypothetical protein